MDRTNTQVRGAEFDIEQARGRADGAIPVVVSTDAVIEMPDGPEMLLHTAEAVDMSRAPLPIIVTHAKGQLNVGIVDDMQLVNGQMRGLAKFGERPEAAGYRADVLNGVIRGVSVGYRRIKGYVRQGVLVTTRWMPSHAAMVAEPGDVNAGFFRSAETTPEMEIVAAPEEAATVSQPAGTAISKEQAMSEAAQATAGQAAESAVVHAQPKGPSAADLEADRIAGIENLCKAGNIDQAVRNVWVTSGASMRAVSDEYMRILQKRADSTPKLTQLDLTPAETRKFSLARAIDACANQNWTNAGFEAECSREIGKKLNRNPDPKSFFVPWEVQERKDATPMEMVAYSIMKRDLTVASGGAGGFLVETANMGFIELLRNKSVLYNMGAVRLSGLQGSVMIPKQSATGSPTWLANEASTISEINQTFVQVALSPKNVGGYTEISRQLLLQSNPSIEGLVKADLAAVVALDIDAKGLNGSGASGQPTGILGTSGVGSVTGTSLDYADIVEFQTDVFAGNALNGACGYVTTGAVAGLLKGRVKFASTASPIWDGKLEDANVDGYRGMASNQMPSATMLFGDFGQVVVGEWGVLEVEVNPFANFQAGIIGVRAIASIDIAVRYPTAFSAASSIT